MTEDDRHRTGFTEYTRTAAARERLSVRVEPLSRTERVPLGAADGRVVATAIDAGRAVPHYERAAMDGFAVRASETFDATDRTPVSFRIGEQAGPGKAARVHTGSELPEGADAVVRVEATEVSGDTVEVFSAVPEGGNVGPVGEDVAADQRLFDAGHRLRPSDLGLLKAVGHESVPVYERPRVSVVPTGEELVQSDPDPGEIIETNGQAVTQYVRRWGGEPTYRDVVTDDPAALRAAIERDLDHDVVVTTGGSSVGERDLVPEVVADLGEVLVHGVALKPGHPVALGIVDETPVLMLPGYPVACIVNAVQFLRPTIEQVGHLPRGSAPETGATLTRKIPSEPGVRTFARVELANGDPPTATPTRAKGAGVLSSVALADGWVVVPEGREGYGEGETVAVQEWEWSR
jgi:molybdopterin molybdotransferase